LTDAAACFGDFCFGGLPPGGGAGFGPGETLDRFEPEIHTGLAQNLGQL
jgi:hypothetical protein